MEDKIDEHDYDGDGEDDRDDESDGCTWDGRDTNFLDESDHEACTDYSDDG